MSVGNNNDMPVKQLVDTAAICDEMFKWFFALSAEQAEELRALDEAWYSDQDDTQRGVTQDWIEENGGDRMYWWCLRGEHTPRSY